MAGSKIEGFFGPPQVVWGMGEDPVTDQDFSDCGLTPAQTRELVQRVVSGQCLQSKQAKHSLHANASFAELWLKEKLWGFLSTFGEESHQLAANLILRELNPLYNQPFDGFIPAKYLVVKAASQYLDKSGEAVKKITRNVIGKVRHKIGRSAHQVVWLDFSEGLKAFIPKKKLQEEFKTRLLHLLNEVFKGYDLSFFLSEAEAKKSFPPGKMPEYITVRFTYEEPKKSEGEQEEMKIEDVIFDPRWRREDFVEALRDKFGEKAMGETKALFWAQAIKKPEIQKLLFLLHYYGTTNSPDLLSMKPAEAYFGNEYLKEEIQVFLGSFILTQWHRDRVVTRPEMKRKTAEANRERLAQLLVYTVFHEMMHTFGVPHLPEHKAGPLFMMYGSESIDLSPLWKGGMESNVEKTELKTLRELLKLVPYDQKYVDPLLKLSEPSKTGQRFIKEKEDESMGCDFTEINDRCYGMHGIGDLGSDEAVLDLLQYEDGSEAKGINVLDEEDLYLAPGASQLTRPPITEKVLFRDDERWWKLGLPGVVVYFGHFFGQGFHVLHKDYYDDILFNHNRDLLINPYFPDEVEAALVTYDTQKIDIYFTAEVQPPQTSPITDQHPSMPVVLCRLRQIATGEKKPLAFNLAKDGTIFSDPEHEATNQKRAVKLLQYYWQMGSETARRILDELNMSREPRFDWVVKKLSEKSVEKSVALARPQTSSCEPFAAVIPPKVPSKLSAGESTEPKSGKDCQAGLLFPDSLLLDGRGAAKKCAELLTKSTGRPHDVEPQMENIGDGFPAVVSQTHYRVVEK